MELLVEVVVMGIIVCALLFLLIAFFLILVLTILIFKKLDKVKEELNYTNRLLKKLLEK